MAGAQEAIAALDALVRRVDDAAREIAEAAAQQVQVLAQAKAPQGTAGNSTNAPGDLSRSILVDGPAPVTAHAWLAKVGPTTVYGRQRELGGDIYPKVARALRFVKFGETVVSAHVYQHPEPYLKPAWREAEPGIVTMAAERVARAVAGRG